MMFPFLFARRMFGGFRNAVPPNSDASPSAIFPEVDVVLEAGGGQFIWAVPRCVCGKRHRHGGGIIGKDDPRKALGHRAAHCMDFVFRNSSGYVLIDRDPERTAETIKTAIRAQQARLAKRVR
jgi:hypothetical protein